MAEPAHPKTQPEALAELHDSIYREKVLRARAMQAGERCSDIFELSSFQLNLMHAGAMKRLATGDENEGWIEVRRTLDRLDHAREMGYYSKEAPTES